MRRGSSYKRFVADRLLVNLKSGPAIEGVAWDDRSGVLVLRNAKVVDGEQEHAADGEILISHADIEFIQRLR